MRNLPTVKTPRELEKMRVAGRMVARVLQMLERIVAPGIRTADLDRAAHQMMKEMGGEPLFLNYRGFPATICVSVNEEVVHGIPGPRVLEEGDIVSIDCGIRSGRYCGDAAMTVAVGAVSPEARRLMEVCRRSLDLAIEAVRPDGRLSDIASAIQTYVEREGFSVVRDFVGHGIGQEMHEEPQVPNYVDEKLRGRDLKLVPGHALAIEPMVNAGTHEVRTLADKWTVVTRDRALSAHFEHTVAVTPQGREVLTRLED